LQIYFLAGAHPPTHLGNPRQVNAYEYPTIYGPRSPSFARATLCRSDSATHLFISGTASVVGHQSQHVGSADLQALETVTNLRALVEHAQFANPSLEPGAKREASGDCARRPSGSVSPVRRPPLSPRRPVSQRAARRS
jgi:chorismate lyase/3-hydroxybenzoate synthase